MPARPLPHHRRRKCRAGVGNFALWQNTNGSDNIIMGFEALMNNTTGSFNTAIGDFGNDSSNFRADLTADGRLNNQDVQLVRSYRGTSLP